MKDTKIYTNTQTEEQRQKELYAATLIHDLKTPLQAQISSLNLIRAGKFGEISDSQKEILDIIIESSCFMKELLNKVLDIYKLENGVIKLSYSQFNLDELVRLCINEIANYAMTYNIEIEYINTLQTPYIDADKEAIRRVIANMLNNGINYSYKNTVLAINLSEHESFVFIKIKNTGYSIPKNIKEHIFDKYVSTAALNNKTGSGLGLYYCKTVIDAHNGDISLNSEQNNNEFIIKLPKNHNISDNSFSFT